MSLLPSYIVKLKQSPSCKATPTERDCWVNSVGHYWDGKENMALIFIPEDGCESCLSYAPCSIQFEFSFHFFSLRGKFVASFFYTTFDMFL